MGWAFFAKTNKVCTLPGFAPDLIGLAISELYK